LHRATALLLLAVLLSGPFLLRTEEKKPEPDRLRQVLEKSLLFPGLGQLAEKQYAKGAVFAASEIACLMLVVINARRGNNAYREYRDARSTSTAVEWRQQAERFDRRRNTAILAGAGVWVCNMVDIFIFAKKKYRQNESVAFHPFYNHENQAIGAGCTCRF
jgi:hypothetical protein